LKNHWQSENNAKEMIFLADDAVGATGGRPFENDHGRYSGATGGRPYEYCFKD